MQSDLDGPRLVEAASVCAAPLEQPMSFPIDLSAFQELPLDPAGGPLTVEQKAALKANIDLCRDTIVCFTAMGSASGMGGHTGGAFDTVPEAMIAYSFIQHARAGGGPSIYPVLFDEAGHRVATQYLLAVLEGDLPAERLLHYREHGSHLPGHPERGFTPGVHFSSGRLGHMWPFVNGLAMARPEQTIVMLGSDGSQMEGNDAEAARLAVAQDLNVKLILDDNDVTIAGHPSDYMKGFDLTKTLEGHGLPVTRVDGEDLDALYAAMCALFGSDGPAVLICERKMAPGIAGIEGTSKGHDVIKKELAIDYLAARGHDEAVAVLSAAPKGPKRPPFRGTTGGSKNRALFGTYMNEILAEKTPEERRATVRVFDNDLEGSCGLNTIREAYPEIFVRGGIMERGNFSAAAGFGYEAGKQGVFATFAAFLEMVISELTMARLNQSNVLCHFSHSSCDDMADNTCHFGINNFFADGGLNPHGGTDNTRLYFPVDRFQFRACLRKIFDDPGCRFIFSNRSALPDILAEDGTPFYGEGYDFVTGTDDVVRSGTAGYVVSYGETFCRALDAVEQLREAGLDVGLVNKCTLNVFDPAMMARLAAAPFVLVAEGQNVKTGLGSRFGSALLKHGFKGAFDHLGVNRDGNCGLWQQLGDQGLDSDGIKAAIERLASS